MRPESEPRPASSSSTWGTLAEAFAVCAGTVLVDRLALGFFLVRVVRVRVVRVRVVRVRVVRVRVRVVRGGLRVWVLAVTEPEGTAGKALLLPLLRTGSAKLLGA